MRLFYALDGPTANLAQESFRPHHNLTQRRGGAEGKERDA